MKKIINTAISGFGLSGRAFHAPFLHVHKGFMIGKVLERHREDSRSLFPYVKVVRNYSDILEDSEIELIVICTPNTHHFNMAKSAILAGKHVVIEKPFANSHAEAKELISLAKKKGIELFVYHNRRWDGDFLTIQRMLRGDGLGEIQYYEAHFDQYSPVRKRAAWRDEALPGSGLLYDLGPHMIDQALQLFGNPDTVEAEIIAQRKDSKVDDFFLITFTYQNMVARLSAGMLVKEPGPRYIIHGSRGSFIKYGIDPQEEALRKGVMPDAENWGEESPDKWGLVTIDYDDDLNFNGQVETLPGNYMAFYDNVYEVLVKGKKKLVKPTEAAEVIRIIELAFESSKTGKKIEIKI